MRRCPASWQNQARHKRITIRIMRKLLTVALLATCISSPFGAARAEGPYLELEKFVVNVRDKSRMRFMQVKVQVLASDPVIRGAVETHMPAVRDTLVMLLSEQNAASMRSAAGREEVREAALTAVQQVMGEFISGGADGTGEDAETPSHGIEALYFTDFVIQ